MTLITDKREYTAGEDLAAEIQSRFADARILVTLRDSQGVRLWKPLQLAGQTTKLNRRLPEDTRYACDLVIQYVEGNGKIHVADQVIRVVPAHRFNSIKTEHKDQMAPFPVTVTPSQPAPTPPLPSKVRALFPTWPHPAPSESHR